MSRPPIQWSRLFIEGFVIVASILLAFAIDAWWDERQEAEEAMLQVDRLVAELEANVFLLERQIEDLDVTTAAAQRFLAKFGPDPAPTEKSEIGVLFNELYASGTIALDRNASERFLASGLLTKSPWLGVRKELSTLLALQQIHEQRSVELRSMRTGINNRISQLMPSLDTSLGHPAMAAYSPSRFPYETEDVLSDMYLEGLVAEYAIRMEINRSGFATLRDMHAAMVESINAARGR